MKHYTCPDCGGSMEWDGAAGGLRCGNCGKAVSVPSGPPAGFHGYEAPPAFPGLEDFPDRAVRCPCCGAETRTDSCTVSMSCPYCGTSLVFDERQLAFARPDAVARCMVSPERVKSLVREWSGKQRFAPDLTSKYMEVKFISPQYIPFWVFEARSRCKYSGRGCRYRKGPGAGRTAATWHPIHGERSDDLRNFGVPAAAGIKKDYADFLFRSTPDDAFSGWKPEYFAGSWSFVPAVPFADAEMQAKDEMKDEIGKRIRSELNCDRAEFSSFNAEFSSKAWRLVQIPGYFVICRYNGGIYVAAVNAVTGEISGTYPVSILKVNMAFIIVTAALFALCAFIEPDMVVTCTEGGCRPSWGSIGSLAAFLLAGALMLYARTWFWLRGRVLGRDDLKESPWLRQIMEKTK